MSGKISKKMTGKKKATTTRKRVGKKSRKTVKKGSRKPSVAELRKMERQEVVKLVLDVCDNDTELAQFFAEWICNGRNATKAAKAIKPHLTDGSAKVIGARLLTRVNLLAIFNALGLGVEEYIKHLKNGLNAKQIAIEKDPETGSVTARELDVPNHEIRAQYHSKLGQILGIETKDGGTNVAVQVNNLINDKRQNYGI